MLTLCLLLQAIPADRTADWSRAGVPEVPVRSRVVEVRGDPQEAIDAAQPDDILLLPAGMYDGLRLKSRITLRGEGPSKTIIKGTLTIGLGGADWWYPHRLRVDVQGKRGVESLRVSDSSKLKPGMVVQLARDLQRQVTQIVSTTETHVTVSPAPLFDLPEGSALRPGGRMAEYVGVEDLGIEGAGRIGIWMAGAYGCWVKNVHVRNIDYAHIQMSDALFCEIRQCYVGSRTGDTGAGIQLATSSFCRIEDNVIVDTQLEVHASSGNVVAYNLFRDFEIYGVLGPAISSNARPQSGFNLYEGNVAPKFQADGHYGGGAHDTVFRNRLHGTSLDTPKSWICVNLSKSTRNASIVGNVLGAPGHPWLYDEGKGNLIYSFGDPDARATAIVKGNFNWKDAKVPEAEAVDPLPPSLYLKSKPAWWGAAAWPPFGPDVAFEKNKIPAETR
ncbi:MAG TPA: right-handed parallel beta-helix repeat-containing protein [Planctomycetota bacterium]